MKKLGILAIVIVPVVMIFVWAFTQYNAEQTLRVGAFASNYRDRTARINKMWMNIKQIGIVAKQTDSSFLRVVEATMNGRKDGEGLAMKWIQEQNPTAQFSEVSSMYKNLTRVIEAEREGLFQQERILSDIKSQDDLMLVKFPGNILFAVFGTQPIEYKPITSDRTDEVIKSGKDNNTDVF